jgi:5'-3' exonuclease
MHRTESNARRVVFERLVHLCKRGATSIICADGIPPNEKAQTLRDRFAARNGYAGGGWGVGVDAHNGYASFGTLSRQCQAIATELGCSTVLATDKEGEGEARCAAACLAGFADAVLSEDADALLFGAPVLIRSVEFDQNGHGVSFDLIQFSTVMERLGLDRTGLTALALLLGTDYGGGTVLVW